jgi:Fuc2NAc and GlcNAc transferase
MISGQSLALILLVGLAASWLLTALARRYALAKQLIDRPNGRSSHSIPTPRGGGLAIVATFLLLTLALGLSGVIERALMVAALGSGTLVAVLGFADDRRPLPARWRFLGHLTAAAWILWCLGRVPAVPMFGVPVDLGLAGPLLCGLYLVWMINLFNFMDGIDGIASIQAITVALGGAVVCYLGGEGSGALPVLVFAACVSGFLIWNFPPAQIFMGDAGSGFLGLMVALFSLLYGHAQPVMFWSWFILGGCFMVDATTTLIRRVKRGERFHEAHRSHAYQYASRRYGSHKTVSLAVGAINLVWLLPIALLVALRLLDGVVGTLIAYAPLVWLAFHYKAGDRAAQEL